MSKFICLNADVGELPGNEGRALDRAILDVVTRCSIACGGHAGDTETMTSTVSAARDLAVRIGAHPSYPDREGFGRSRMNLSDNDLASTLLAQVRTLQAIASEFNADVAHLKPHGALYNDAAKSEALAEIVVCICLDTKIPELIGPPGSALHHKAQQAGVSFVAEAFADRSYEADGRLTPRTEEGAVITDEARQLDQVFSLVESGSVKARTGERIAVPAQTICLHGDTPGAARSALLLKKALLERGVSIKAQ
ncbi:5-oxoprolinase subunit PxpA [Hyphomonas sp. ND6WE1B]|jgi:UPF0271 protein|uniref:5-oxoprolinase subunit PxpA n=1 Tax=Hyphomonas sp. ND6WE1B TaxID=1848191 RepID=UPI0008076BA4|nr:5-oxoprolinase subunit PxpA [Hyphomonas sp. ND6WE1B]